MIIYHKHHEIDRDRWDECIRKSFNGIIYAYSWYLDIVSPQWEALIEGEYESVMPLTPGKQMGVSYLFPPFFSQQLGVFSVKKLTAEAVHAFLDAIPEVYRYWEINLNTFNKVDGSDYEYRPNLTHELDLIDSYENIRKGYAENARRNLKKAEAGGLKLTTTPSREEIISLFRAGRGSKVKNLLEAQYDTLRRLLQALDARGRLHARGVLNERGELIAGAFFVDANGKVIFLFSGLNNEGKEKASMYFLIDNFIRENAHKNLVLDFEGSNDRGIARFYRGFGAKECVYLQARCNRLPWPIRLLKQLRERSKNLL
ncbi:MAG TPA: GNAT family N-acetyltransferase [Bacteroidia bacterium]|nr:GNAT family N-acetyltransferase [Bacteroidia bacterium]